MSVHFNWLAQMNGRMVASFNGDDGTVELFPTERAPIVLKAAPDYDHRVEGLDSSNMMAIHFELLADYVGGLRDSVVELLGVLPDSEHEKDSDDPEEGDCWDWCWNELDCEAQDLVKEARIRASRTNP